MEQRFLLPGRIATRGIFVAHDDRWLHFGAESRELISRVRAIADSQHEAAFSFSKLLRRLREPFDHEGVVADIRLRITREQAEENDNRLPESICCGDCCVERRIVEGALRSAHPVHDTSSAWVNGLSMAHPYAWIENEVAERCHQSALPVGRLLTDWGP